MTDRAVADETLLIKLIGGFAARVGERSPPSIASRTARSLLAYLASHRDRAHGRDLLAATFWPDAPPQRARRRLSHALWEVSSALGGVIAADGQTARFAPPGPYELDVEGFERGLARLGPGAGEPDLEAAGAALALYRGDFMAGFYDDWVLLERDRLRELFLGGLERLARAHRARGEPEAALARLQTLARHDPLREDAHREVMRLCALLGRPGEALEQYERCRRVLEEELGVAPAPETVALHREVLRQAAGATPSPPPPTEPPLLDPARPLPLVGRDAERAALLELLDGALAGGGGVALVEGEAGLGKTRLLEELALDATWRGAETLWGRGREHGAAAPYGSLREALEAGLTGVRAERVRGRVEGVWLREAARVVPALARPDLPASVALPPEQEAGRLREALAHTVAALGRTAPHLLILDDLQWADEASLQALPALARQLQGVPVLLVLAYRREEARERPAAWAALRALNRGGARRLTLGPLEPVATGELVRRGLGLVHAAPDLEARLCREAGGNPLFVIETLRAMLEHPGEPENLADADLPLPASVREVVVSRLSRLGPAARAVLDAAAVVGRAADLDLLSATSGLPRPEALEAADALVGRGLLVEEAGSWRFGHDVQRAVAYGELPDPWRRALHRQAGEALEAGGEQPEGLARHFEEGQVWGKAASYHGDAGRRASALHAFESALAHHDRALALAEAAGLSPTERLELLAAREETLDVLGRRAAQLADLGAMSALAPPGSPRLVAVRCRLARALALLGRLEEAGAVAREALTLARRLGDAAGQAEAWTALGQVALGSGDRAEAVLRRRAALEFYERHGDPKREAEARALLASALVLTQRYEEARTELKAALILYGRLGDRRGRAGVLKRLANVWEARGEYRRAELCYRLALETSRAIGDRSSAASVLVNWAMLAEQQGRVGRALGFHEEALAAFGAVEEPEGEATAHLNLATLLASALGDYAGALEHAEAALGYHRRVGNPNGEAHGLIALAMVAEQRGNLALARRHLESSLALLQGAGNRWLGEQVRLLLAGLAVAEGRAEDALKALASVEATCLDLGLLALLPEVGLRRATTLLALDRPVAALAELEGGPTSSSGDPGRTLEFHLCHHRALVALARPGESRAALERARAALEARLEGLSAERRRASLAGVPEHRAVVEAWEALHLRREAVRLPRAGVPTGRPLREDERTEVGWTLDAPEDRAHGGEADRRQHRLRRLVREAAEAGAAPTVDDLAAALGASRATVKRDLAAMRRSGDPVETRGSRAGALDALE